MSRLTRGLVAATGLVIACATIALTAGAAGAKTNGRPDSGTVYISITHTAGNYEYAAGNSTDKILGKGAVTYKITAGGSTSGAINVKVNVTVFTNTGSLSGTATATLTVTGSTETVSNGKLNLTKGAGSQKGHSFVGTFSGSGSLTANQLVFHEKGTYK